MATQSKSIPVLLLLIGAIGIILGIAFITQGLLKKNFLQTAMRVETVTLGDVHAPNAPADALIDSGSTAKIAADTIREHRRKISPSYKDLLGGKHYDPTNPKQLTYAQALNMENYLYMSVLAFGLIDVVMGSGVFMILMGLAVGCIGIVFLRQKT